MEIPRWWWCCWVLLVICGTAIEISLQLWEGCPGIPALLISMVQSIQEIRMSLFFVCVFILKPILPELCPFTGTCILLMLELWPGALNRSRFLLTYTAVLCHTNSLLFFWLYSSYKSLTSVRWGILSLTSPREKQQCSSLIAHKDEP